MIRQSATIVHMGDSITFGQYLDPALRWTSLIEERLHETLGDAVEIRSFNRGISGETTRMGSSASRGTCRSWSRT